MEARPSTEDAPAPEAPPAGDKPAEAPAEAPAPAPEAKPEDKPAEPEPTAAEARKILAQAHRTLTEAKAAGENALKDLATEMRRSPRAALAKLAKLVGAPLDVEDIIDLDIADTNSREAKPDAKPAEDEATKRLQAIEDKIAAAEAREQQARADARIAQIQADVAKDARFPTINARGKAGLVTKFMISYHARNGQAIPWDKAAQIVESDLRSLSGGAAPAPKPAPAAAPPAESPRQETLRGETRDYVPPQESELPKDPDKLLEYLVKHAYTHAGKSLS